MSKENHHVAKDATFVSEAYKYWGKVQDFFQYELSHWIHNDNWQHQTQHIEQCLTHPFLVHSKSKRKNKDVICRWHEKSRYDMGKKMLNSFWFFPSYRNLPLCTRMHSLYCFCSSTYISEANFSFLFCYYYVEDKSRSSQFIFSFSAYEPKLLVIISFFYFKQNYH